MKHIRSRIFFYLLFQESKLDLESDFVLWIDFRLVLE